MATSADCAPGKAPDKFERKQFSAEDYKSGRFSMDVSNIDATKFPGIKIDGKNASRAQVLKTFAHVDTSKTELKPGDVIVHEYANGKGYFEIVTNATYANGKLVNVETAGVHRQTAGRKDRTSLFTGSTAVADSDSRIRKNWDKCDGDVTFTVVRPGDGAASSSQPPKPVEPKQNTKPIEKPKAKEKPKATEKPKREEEVRYTLDSFSPAFRELKEQTSTQRQSLNAEVNQHKKSEPGYLSRAGAIFQRNKQNEAWDKKATELGQKNEVLSKVEGAVAKMESLTSELAKIGTSDPEKYKKLHRDRDDLLLAASNVMHEPKRENVEALDALQRPKR